MTVRENLIKDIHSIIKKMGGDFTPVVEAPSDLGHGDYTTNAAMVLGKKQKRNPMEVGEEIKKQFSIFNFQFSNKSLPVIEKIEVVRPGFINFWLSKEYLSGRLGELGRLGKIRVNSSFTGKRILVEYAHPNTHKEMHIGHMRTLITGEALARILEAGGAKVFRANYQGDIGPHVAKALYGIMRILDEKVLRLGDLESSSDRDKAHFLGEGYVRGNKDYEEHKDEIDLINKQLYGYKVRNKALGFDKLSQEKAQPKNIFHLYQITRQWSLDYYEDFYKRFYTKFDMLFFESEMTEEGKRLVLEHVGDIFKKDNGAIIFEGEKYGLHTRVFISSQGNALYEAKDMWNAYKQYEAFPFDLNIHVVASEQKGYFEVVIKALELIDPGKFKGTEQHLSMGMVQLKNRKISSRTGDILTVDWLIDQVKSRVDKLIKVEKSLTEEHQLHNFVIPSEERAEESHTTDFLSQTRGMRSLRSAIAPVGMTKPDVSEDIAKVCEMITIGAIKYSVLRVGAEQNVVFDIDKSVSLEGNSGPYLQYTYARTQSVLRKSKVKSPSNPAGRQKSKSQLKSKKFQNKFSLQDEELALLRLLVRFGEVVGEAGERLAPNILCNYLFVLCQGFNLFYQKLPILKEKEEAGDFRLALTEACGRVIRDGLGLLGIESPERM